MPRAEIATKQAKFTLIQLHKELAGKALENKANRQKYSGRYRGSANSK